MLDIQTQLFEARDIHFAPIDHEKDAEVEAKWTHDAEFMRLMELKPVRAMSPAMLKKQYEKIEKDIDENHNLYYFTVHTRSDERLIGKAALEWIEWSNGNGWVRLGIGPADERRKGYGTQILQLLLRFAFAELNLFRVSALVPEYNQAMIALLKKFGFVEEVRRRESVERDGRFWDLLSFGLLKTEWEALPSSRLAPNPPDGEEAGQ